MSFAPRRRPIIAAALVFIFVAGASAQTTAFTYQGKLVESGNPANGQRDFQFKLFDLLSGGAQQGATLTLNSVAVSNGIFTVNLDFGSNFPGANRFLEISVKLTGDPTYTTLAPRQPVTSTPYSVRSLAATTADGLSVTCINCVTSSQIQSVQGSQVTGPIPVASVPAGSGNYIQNTTGQQATSNFNISGDGTAGGTLTGNIVSATQYNIGAGRVFTISGSGNTFVGIGTGSVNTGTNNTFIGRNAGLGNTTGGSNVFFGTSAGLSNTGGSNNAFLGTQAGQANTTGSSNSFVGYQTGISNTTANNNSFFGTFAGLFNSTGANNTFVGMNAGRANTTASGNAFFGSASGQANNAGASNAFFGSSSGTANTTGTSNSFFGFNAGLGNTTGGNNSFFGQNAGAGNTTGIHNSFFGDSAGAANTASFNAFFGDSAGLNNTTGDGNAFFGRGAGLSNTTGSNNSFFGSDAGVVNTGRENSFFGSGAGFSNTTGVGNSFFGSGTGNATIDGVYNSYFGFAAGGFNNGGDSNTIIGAKADVNLPNLDHATAIGADAIVLTSHTISLGRLNGFDLVYIPGNLDVESLGTAGSTSLCRNASNLIATCSSSLRYKTNFAPYRSGLDIIARLRPITFDWKQGGMHDVGLGAEDVAQIEPLLVTHNAKGEIEGVKYNQLSVVFINAIKEQQAQIKSQQAQLARQQREIEAVKRLVCPGYPNAALCQSSRPSKSRHRRQ